MKHCISFLILFFNELKKQKQKNKQQKTKNKKTIPTKNSPEEKRKRIGEKLRATCLSIEPGP